MLLEELIGDLAAEKLLTELVRFFLSEKAELTPVYCLNNRPRLDGEEISEIQDEERTLLDQLEEEIDAVLTKLTGRNTVDLWEEFFLRFVVTKSRSRLGQLETGSDVPLKEIVESDERRAILSQKQVMTLLQVGPIRLLLDTEMNNELSQKSSTWPNLAARGPRRICK